MSRLSVPTIVPLSVKVVLAARWRLAWAINEYAAIQHLFRYLAGRLCVHLWKSADKAPLAAEAMGIIAPV